MIRYKWWWGWNTVVLEDYLENMASKGYLLESASLGMIRFSFVKAKPQKIRYCVDFHSKYDEEYRLVIQDAGWNIMAESQGWILLAQTYDEERPDLYTDNSSLIERSQRLLNFVTILTCSIFLPGVIYIAISGYDTNYIGDVALRAYLLSIYSFSIVMYIYFRYKIKREIKRLK